MKKIAIDQSNYIPWKGYFDMINMVDEFILYDDMQYTRRDWRNRNRIVTPSGTRWLTIPVDVKGKYYQKIKDTKVSDPEWARRHWRSLQENYARAPYFRQYADRIHAVYERVAGEPYLSRINHAFLTEICDILGIRTKISWSMDYELCEGKTERLAKLVKDAGGDHYLSGPRAKDYIEADVFEREHIGLEWMDYSGYPEYRQVCGDFDPAVTILDLIFNTGEDAPSYMKSFT